MPRIRALVRNKDRLIGQTKKVEKMMSDMQRAGLLTKAQVKEYQKMIDRDVKKVKDAEKEETK